MKLAIIGTGYVGLVTGADFACRGIDVVCVDIDAARIDGLLHGVMPFFEAGLEELFARGVAAEKLSFTTDAAAAIVGADVVMCAVGTPPQADGHADLSAVFAVAKIFAAHAKDGAVLVNKSTVPVGTAEICFRIIVDARRETPNAERNFAVVSNPEFLSQGTAVEDTAHPTRIVVGSAEQRVHDVLRALNASFLAEDVPYLEMSLRSAEAVKCAANAFLATKISFINEIANFCEHAGGDVADVAKAMGLDPRIGPQFLRAGIGYGGGCLSKDVRSLIASADDAGYAFRILPAVEAVNDAQLTHFFEKVSHALGGFEGKTVAVWGLSFKPGTDDIRNAPSIPFIRRLLADGATVRAYDPAAMERARRIFDGVTFAATARDAASGADAIVILTEWDEFKKIDFSLLTAVFSGRVVADGRGALRGRMLPSSWHVVTVGVDN